MVTGSTMWSDDAVVRRELARLPPGSVIVTGDTPGIDALALEIAPQLGHAAIRMKKNNADKRRFPEASWKGLNERMMATGIDLVLAFHPDYALPDQARGTKHAIALAQDAGVEFRVHIE